MKKILVIYATAGAGHKKAAQAIKNAFGKIHPEADVKFVDSLDYTPPVFRFTYPRGYLFLVDHIPNIWGLGYYLLDCPFIYAFFHPIRCLVIRLSSRPLVEYILREQPDVVVSTHFFASEVIAGLRRNGRFKGRLIACVTDIRLHSFWVARGADKFVVAADQTREDLVKRGIPQDKIEVLGIPVDPLFTAPLENGKKHAEQHFPGGPAPLENGKKHAEQHFPTGLTILVTSGGFGVGPTEKIINLLNRTNLPLQLLVVCGKNERLRRRLEKNKASFRVTLKIYGFVDNMDELMDRSDLVITKAGGLTTSEALAKRLPMIIMPSIPGQETRNAKFLVEHGAAINITRVRQIPKIITELFKNRESLQKMVENIDKIRRPYSAERIAELAWRI